MTYRIELQAPYGRLVRVWQTKNRKTASIYFMRAVRSGGRNAFVPVTLNGKEIPPAELRRSK